MPTLLSTVTIIEHPNDPNNVYTMSKREQPRRLLVLVGRKGYDTFSDEPGSPMGKGLWVSGFSRVHWDWLRTRKIDWFLNNSHKYPNIKAREYLEGDSDYCDRICNFMLQRLRLDPNVYYVISWLTDTLKPLPKLHQIKK